MNEHLTSEKRDILISIIGAPILLPFALIVVAYIWLNRYGEFRS